MPLSLRKIDTFQDEEAAEEIRFLDKLCFDPKDVKAELERGVWWLLRDKKEPVAYAGLRESTQWKEWGYLCRAGVHPKYRGRGLQRRLLQARIKYARAIGWNGLITDTSYGNIHSANNLIRAGFKMFQPVAPWAFSNAGYWVLYF